MFINLMLASSYKYPLYIILQLTYFQPAKKLGKLYPTII